MLVSFASASPPSNCSQIIRKKHKSLVMFAGGSCTWGSRCRILPYGTANTTQICAKPAISCAVFIARRLQGGLMVWTNCCLALIGLFSLSEWFSGGSVVYMSTWHSSFWNGWRYHKQICAVIDGLQEVKQSGCKSFCLAPYPVQAPVTHKSTVVLILKYTSMY